MRRVLLSVLLSAAPFAATAETRCGWIVNPTPGNWWLNDADGAWTLMTQGSEGVPGMDLLPDFTASGEWIEVNGSYGYGCACMEVQTDGVETVYAILAVRQLPLSRCEADPALPGLD